MLRLRWLRLAVLGGWLASSGCMALREVPRAEYAARAERKAVRVETREGLLYEFDYASIASDSLIGYRNRTEFEGPLDQVAVFKIPLDEIQRLTTRQVDWRRTCLVGGGVVAAALAVGLRQAAQHGDTGPVDNGGGGKGFNPSASRPH
jgi:hypothetical protein